jgi:hypothetical protein
MSNFERVGLNEISGFHGGDNLECGHLGYDAM